MAERLTKNTKKFYQLIGEKIRQLRDDKQLNQEDMAKKCGTSRLSYLTLENGNKKIPLHQLFLIADALQIEVKDLIIPQQEALEILKKPAKRTDRLTKERFEKARLDDILSKLPAKEE